MRKLRTAGLIAVLGLLLFSSCSSVPPAERWSIRVIGTDGADVGRLLVDPTAEPVTGACLSRPDMKRGRVIEKSGFTQDPIREFVGLEVGSGRFFAELTPGICDASLALEGALQGDSATGTAVRSTFAGPRPAGTFVAERVR